MTTKEIFLLVRPVMLLIVIAFIISCNEDAHQVISEDGLIGPEGGVVIGEDGIILDIPPGALDVDTVITANLISENEIPIPPPERSFLVVGVELKPDGLEFNTPITITVPIDFEYEVDMSLPVLTFNSTENTLDFETVAFVNENGTSISWQQNHFSIQAIYNFIFDSEEQIGYKKAAIKNTSIFLNQYKGYCFFDEKFLSLGDINKVTNALFDITNNINIHIDPDYLVNNCSGGCEATYVESCTKGCNDIYFNDIILQDGPTNLDPYDSDIFHELIHATFDQGYSIFLSPIEAALLLRGDSGEVVPEYLEFFVLNNLDCRLIGKNVRDPDKCPPKGPFPYVEEEFAKAREGKPCDLNGVIKQLDGFITESDNFFKGRNITPQDSIQILNIAKSYVGLDVDPRVIKKKYLDEQLCGVCDPSTQPSPEICNDGIDNNDNGLLDCADPDCTFIPSCQDTCDLSNFQFLSFVEGNPGLPGDGIFVGSNIDFIFNLDPTFPLNGVSDGVTFVVFPGPSDITDFQEEGMFMDLTLLAHGTCFAGLSASNIGQILLNGATGFVFNVSQLDLENAISSVAGFGSCGIDITINDFSIFSIFFDDPAENPLFPDLDAAAIGIGQSACSGEPLPEPTPLPTPIPTPSPTSVDCSPPSWTATPGSSRTFMASGGTGTYLWSLNPPDANCTSTINGGGTSFTISCSTVGNREIFLEDDDPETTSDTCLFKVTKPIFGEF